MLFYFYFLYLTFTFLALFILGLLAKKTDLVLPPQSVCLNYCQRIIRKHFQNTCLVVFSICSMLVHKTESLVHKNRFDSTSLKHLVDIGKEQQWSYNRTLR